MTLRINVTAVAIGGRAVLIEGPPESGKSSLALALIDRGAVLIGDDGVTLTLRDTQVIAAPPPHNRGLIEVRNVGLVARPTAPATPVALMLRLDPEAPRFVDRPETAACEGVAVPLIRLWPDSPVLPLRAEAALERWGLP